MSNATIRIRTFNGHDLAADRYECYATFGDRLYTRQTSPVLQDRMGRHPSYQRADRQDAKITLRIAILGTSSADTILDRLDELNGWFALERRGDLVVSFGDSLRKIEAYVEQVIPQDGAPNRFTVALRAPDPRWVSEREIFYDNGGVSCSGDNLVTDSERDAALESDGLTKIATYGSTGLWPGHTNMAWNSSGETDALGWGTLGATGTPIRDVSKQLSGVASIKGTYSTSTTVLTYESGGVGVGNTFTAGKWYSAWSWILLGSAWNGGDVRIQQYRMDSQTSAEQFVDAQDAHLGGDNWQFIQTIWYQDTTTTGGVKFKALGSPSGAAKVFHVDDLNIVEFDSYDEIVLGPNVLTDGAPSTHTYGVCTADASSYSTAQGWFMARIRAGFVAEWATDQDRDRTVFGWYDDPNNYLHAYFNRAMGAGSYGAFVLERMNGGVLDQHVVDAASAFGIDTLRTERDYVTVCFSWTNSSLAISQDGGAFDTDSSISTNGIPAVTNPLVEIGSLNEGLQLCGDVVWAAAGSGTVDNTEVSALYNGGSDQLPSSFSAADAQFFAWDANDATAGDGITEFSLWNNGNVVHDEMRVVIKPTVQKDPADHWTLSRDVIIANRVPRSFTNYALDLTDGGLNTAALVSGSKARADGDDFRVLIDGVEVPRWFGEDASNDFNSTATTVWANIDLEPARIAALSVAASNSDTTLTFERGTLAGWPTTGFAVIDSECIRYASRTGTVMSGVTRGVRGTTAASHSTAANAYWCQRRVQFAYGYSGASAPEARSDLKPLIDLDVSTNTTLRWSVQGFDVDNPRRSMAWARVLREVEALQNRFAISPSPTGGFVFLSRFRLNGPIPGEAAANTVSFRCPTGTGSSSGNVMSITNSEDFTHRTSLFGIDSEGGRRLIGNYTPVSDSGAATQTFASPGDDMINIEIMSTLGRVFGTPFAISEEATPPIIENLGTAPGGTYRQKFTVPAAKDVGGASIAGFSAHLKLTNNIATAFSVVIRCKLQKEDPDNLGSYVDLAAADVTFNQASGFFDADDFAPRYFFFTTPAPVVPGDELAVELEYLTKNSGTIVGGIQWGGNTLSYRGDIRVMDFFGYSQDLDYDGIAQLPKDGQGAGSDNIIIYLNSAGVPKMVLGAEQTDAYFIDAVLANETTGQSVEVKALIAVNDELEVSMETGAAKNLTDDISIANLTTFSDDDGLIELNPGQNRMSYTEADTEGVAIQAYYRHTWQ